MFAVHPLWYPNLLYNAIMMFVLCLLIIFISPSNAFWYVWISLDYSIFCLKGIFSFTLTSITSINMENWIFAHNPPVGCKYRRIFEVCTVLNTNTLELHIHLKARSYVCLSFLFPLIIRTLAFSLFILIAQYLPRFMFQCDKEKEFSLILFAVERHCFL